ncbi:Alpha/Beta hydrolase protein [Fusarium oxysporum]|nr:Alpha/Beta hydrolase protein [Fusarium oxysporum]
MSKYGLDEWHNADKPDIDIVFIHGLRGHREETWKKDGILWPKDLLAVDIKNCRIMSFGYDAGVIHSDTAEVTQGSLENVARSLCALLVAARNTAESAERPIILVAHSLGGLVCAEAVVLGDRNATGDSVQVISQHVKGMVFLGTPFSGANAAKWGDLVRKIFNAVKKTDHNTLKTIKENSVDLKKLGEAFQDVIRKRNGTMNKIEIKFFYEELDTYGIRVVEEKSASYPGIGEILPIRSNHINICKFSSKDDNGYVVVKAKLIELIQGIKGRPLDGSAGSGNTIFHNYAEVAAQAGRDMNVQRQNLSTGSGNQFPGASFSGDLHFGKNVD